MGALSAAALVTLGGSTAFVLSPGTPSEGLPGNACREPLSGGHAGEELTHIAPCLGLGRSRE